jgi:hypothetical protein
MIEVLVDGLREHLEDEMGWNMLMMAKSGVSCVVFVKILPKASFAARR